MVSAGLIDSSISQTNQLVARKRVEINKVSFPLQSTAVLRACQDFLQLKGELLSKGVEKEKRRPYPSYFSNRSVPYGRVRDARNSYPIFGFVGILGPWRARVRRVPRGPCGNVWSSSSRSWNN